MHFHPIYVHILSSRKYVYGIFRDRHRAKVTYFSSNANNTEVSLVSPSLFAIIVSDPAFPWNKKANFSLISSSSSYPENLIEVYFESIESLSSSYDIKYDLKNLLMINNFANITNIININRMHTSDICERNSTLSLYKILRCLKKQ